MTNVEFQNILKQYPDDAIISIEYCNVENMQYDKESNLIIIQ